MGEFEGHPFLVMELLEGRTLREYIDTQPRDFAQIVQLAAEVVDTLEAAHAKGIVHRDIKPANIFVTERYQRAIEVDPSFAMAYARLGYDYPALGQVRRATEYLKRAFELREHSSEPEKLQISATYYLVTGQLEKAGQTYEEIIASYPRDADATTVWHLPMSDWASMRELRSFSGRDNVSFRTRS